MQIDRRQGMATWALALAVGVCAGTAARGGRTYATQHISTEGTPRRSSDTDRAPAAPAIAALSAPGAFVHLSAPSTGLRLTGAHKHYSASFATPFAFERNCGQAGRAIQYLYHGPQYSLFLRAQDAVLELPVPNDASAKTEAPRQPGAEGAHQKGATARHTAACALADRARSAPVTSALVRFHLVGANAAAAPTALDEQPGVVNYLIGPQSHWTTGVKRYARVRYQDVYPGIDLIYYGTDGRLEYDLVVRPGADPSRIKLEVSNGKLALGRSGDLRIALGRSVAVWKRPVIYQETAGMRKPVSGRYRLCASGHVRFQLGPYDHRLPLVIDPAFLYSTFLGGIRDDVANGIAMDAQGNIYVAGSTSSVNFPTTLNAVQWLLRHGTAGFVTKFTASGQLAYSTFLGGPLTANAPSGSQPYAAISAIAVDAGGNAYVTGTGNNVQFPTTPGAINNTGNVFVSKIAPQGNGLLYSGVVGSGTPFSAAVDALGRLFIVGQTNSDYNPTWPVTANGYQLGLPSHAATGFLTQLDPTGAQLIYSTYLGGASNDAAYCVKVDASGYAYVAGRGDQSTLAPSPGTHIDAPVALGDNNYIAKFNTNAGSVVFISKLNGLNGEYSVAVDQQGYVYGIGDTYSGGEYVNNQFVTWAPTFSPNSYPNGGLRIVKLSPDGSNLLLAIHAFGAASNGGYPYPSAANRPSIAADAQGLIYTAGITGGSIRTTPGALKQDTENAQNQSFLTVFSADGERNVFSTYLGGEGGGATAVNGLVIDTAGNAFVTGGTGDPSYPTTSNAFTQKDFGGQEAFLTKLLVLDTPADLNGDGQSDIVLQNQQSGDVGYWLLSGGAKIGGGAIATGNGAGWNVVASAYLNNDPFQDLLWENTNTGMLVYWLMQGAQRADGDTLAQAVDPNWRAAAMADVDADTTGQYDSNPDIIWENRVTGSIAYWSMEGPEPLFGDYLPTNGDPNWQIVATADMNRDGWPDLIFQNQQTGGVVIWYMENTVKIGSAQIVASQSPNWKLVGAADMNRDGWPDLIWQNTANGAVQYWLMQNTTQIGAGTIVSAQDPNWRVILPH